ncbi:hypothetical protein CYMTET_52819 [Cymbomonas tetramitiformis]|uniref:Uncharacterized protein n=1 Tax=Cymbomonas tetramitiformis TaxID=36881 RepID=A0AAE0BJM4_9CHLO|nr:hypothetical protein CYMTET_52819 [Cymbomonas tetramitiformis]
MRGPRASGRAALREKGQLIRGGAARAEAEALGRADARASGFGPSAEGERATDPRWSCPGRSCGPMRGPRASGRALRGKGQLIRGGAARAEAAGRCAGLGLRAER